MFTKEEIALAKPCYEAIKKIGGNVEKKCRGCDGGSLVFPRGSNCTNCNGTGKVKGKWEWEPEIGNWCISKGGLMLISEFSQTVWARTDLSKSVKPVPLLQWERIERLLEGMGYWLKVERLPFNGCRAMTGSLPKDYQVERWVMGKTRSEAVYAAVIELGKGE